MNGIRDEKVTFRRHDIVDLHSLPSAGAADPIIVHAPYRRFPFARRCMKSFIWSALALCLIVAAAATVVETGMLDRALNQRALQAINNSLGDRYHATVDSTVVRLSGSGGLALKAQGVTLVENQSGKPLVTTDAVLIELDSLSLLRGRIAVSMLEADGAMLDSGLLPTGRPIDLSAVRIDGVPEAMEDAFARIDEIAGFIARSRTNTVRLSNLTLSFTSATKKTVAVVVDTIDFTRTADGSMAINGDFSVDGSAATLSLKAVREGAAFARVEGVIENLVPGSALIGRNDAGDVIGGLETSFDLDLEAVRAIEDEKPRLHLKLSADAGMLYVADETSNLNASHFSLGYDFDRLALDIRSSEISMGKSRFPLTGAIMDIDRIDASQKSGFAIDLLFRSAVSAPVDSSEAPLVFDAKLNGRYLPDERELVFSELAVSSPLGSLAGSLAFRFGDRAPEITFVALASELESAAVKQMWPWWMAKGARRWVVANLFGGTVTNGRIEIALPEGRLDALPGPLRMNADELKIAFDIKGARMNVAGNIPPIRDTSGTFSLAGERVEITISGGTAYFASGRSAKLEGGDFIIPKTYDKPLMAEMRIGVSGAADAIAELVTYKPIDALRRTDFAPEDFTGTVKGEVGARFGLVADQNPPEPDWQVAMTLEDVALKKEVAGRTISGLNGRFQIDPRQAELVSKAKIDGIEMDLSLIEPVGRDGEVSPERRISGTIDSAQLAKLAPTLGELVDGPISLDITLNEAEKSQKVEADLSRATLSIPWIGWSKGSGIAAKARFTAVEDGKATSIRDFEIDGDGFGAKGRLSADKAGLVSADFSRVKLSAADNYALSVQRQKGGYAIRVDGSAADVRPVLAQLKSSSSKSGNGDKTISVRAKLDTVSGFNGISFRNVDFTYSIRNGKPLVFDLSAVTDGGQALAGKLGDGVLELTSGDAGAFARFNDLYRNMRGGLLNLRLKTDDGKQWRGSLDVRNFSLIDEERLKSIVSTRTGEDGRSLNQAVRRDIDVSSVPFERGFADLYFQGGTLRIERGVVRGPMVGATFQGVARDASGNMDMTGTFMPAYGLNRLFAELPIVGILLGNGRDRGLIGITFRLAGKADKPQLTINPLSIIAPGVFRSIFEF